MAGQGSGAVFLELLGEQDRGGGVAPVRRAYRHLVLAQHALLVY